VRHVGT